MVIYRSSSFLYFFSQQSRERKKGMRKKDGTVNFLTKDLFPNIKEIGSSFFTYTQ